MTAVSSTIGMQSATQAAFQQLKLQQARQNADRAEQVARSLQTEAANAQREAARAQENANSLSVRSSQAQGEAGKARQGVELVRSVSGMTENLSSVLDRVSEGTPVAKTPASTATPPAPSAPVVNTSGQVTGSIINTIA